MPPPPAADKPDTPRAVCQVTTQNTSHRVSTAGESLQYGHVAHTSSAGSERSALPPASARWGIVNSHWCIINAAGQHHVAYLATGSVASHREDAPRSSFSAV